jgi:hypothetical protein
LGASTFEAMRGPRTVNERTGAVSTCLGRQPTQSRETCQKTRPPTASGEVPESSVSSSVVHVVPATVTGVCENEGSSTPRWSVPAVGEKKTS